MTEGNDVSAEAIDWLAGRLRWEHILRDLHERAAGDAPVASVEDITAAIAAIADDDRAA